MDLNALDVAIVLAFVVTVVGVGIYKSRRERTSEDYFLAGRGLSWWLIGFSLIAANISTEQFVGMSGSSAGPTGLAIASFEWIAAITLVFVAFFFLPHFLRAGIYTIPEFLEYRYNKAARTIMAAFMVAIYVFVTIAAVVYSGALTARTLFEGHSAFGIPIDLVSASWFIGAIACIYVVSGGLKACAWADLLQGSALIAGGAIICYFVLERLGAAPAGEIAALGGAPVADDANGVAKFLALNRDKLHMVLPSTNEVMPWTALIVGIWIPNFYYWGLNQYVTQRTLGSRSLAQGQRGIVFAAALKLLIPFIVVIPGIAAFNIFSGDMAKRAARDNEEVLAEYEALKARPPEAPFVVFDCNADFERMYPGAAAEIGAYNRNVELAAARAGGEPTRRPLIGYKYDAAFPLLMREMLPAGSGLRGFVLAAILGAVVSSIAAMLNAASTMFTMDFYHRYAGRAASQRTLVLVGRLSVIAFAIMSCAIAPLLDHPRFKGIFYYIQEFQGYFSPGILAVFIVGFVSKRAPPAAGILGLILSPGIYLGWHLALPELSFLNCQAATFFTLLAVMSFVRWRSPLAEPFVLPARATIELESSRGAMVFGAVVIAATIALYAIFW